MIRLFRKIRNELLGEDKYGTYLLYASGEILLVVIGILIALQVDNWNTNRMEQKELITNLVVVKESLNEEIQWLEDMRSVNEFRFHSINYMLGICGYDPFNEAPEINPLDSTRIWPGGVPDVLDSAFIRLGFLWSARPSKFVSHTGAIEDLKASGLFSRIRNDGLKKSINSYTSRLNWYFGEGPENSTFNQTMSYRDYVRDGFGYLLFAGTDLIGLLDFLRQDGEFAVRITEMAGQAGWRITGCSEMIGRARDLIAEIDREIQ